MADDACHERRGPAHHLREHRRDFFVVFIFVFIFITFAFVAMFARSVMFFVVLALMLTSVPELGGRAAACRMRYWQMWG